MHYEKQKQSVLNYWKLLTRTGENFNNKNIVFIRGIVKDMYYIGNNRYETTISVMRPNNKEDLLKVRFRPSKHTASILEGSKIEIIGKYLCDDGENDDGNPCKQMFIFAKYVRVMDFDEELIYDNLCIIEGQIIERPFYRITPSNEKIIDITLDIIGSSKYPIPCIAWKSIAEELDAVEPGTRVKILGSIHSKYNPFREKHEVNIRSLRFIF